MAPGSGARTWFPNQRLAAAPFSNVSASAERGDSIKVLVDMDTPAGVIEAVREAAAAAAAAMPTEFAGEVSVSLGDPQPPLKATLGVAFKYAHCGADAGRAGRAKTAVFEAVCAALAVAGVQYTYPPARRIGDGGYAAGGGGGEGGSSGGGAPPKPVRAPPVVLAGGLGRSDDPRGVAGDAAAGAAPPPARGGDSPKTKEA